MKNLFQSSGGYKWTPDADAVNAPSGALLVADNLVPDLAGGQLTLRRGCVTSTGYATSGTNVDTLYTVELAGTTYRFAGIDDQVFRNGGDVSVYTDLGITFDSSGDIVFGDDAYQCFFARGTVKKKWDGDDLYNWGIAAPISKPTLSGAKIAGTTIADFDSDDSTGAIPGTVSYPDKGDGTTAFVSGYDGTASGATSFTPDSTTGRASYCKLFTSTTDLSTLNGYPEDPTDIFDFFVWLEEPAKVNKITVMFGMNTGAAGADPFVNDHYFFDFVINPTTVEEATGKESYTALKDPSSAGRTSYYTAALASQQPVAPADLTSVKTPEEAQASLYKIGEAAGPVSRARTDSQQSSPAWTHFSVTRGQFSRVGASPNVDWTTITAFKIIYQNLPGNTEKAYFDTAVFYGGGMRALTGTYRCVYRFVRSTGQYYELSPPSPVSDPISLVQSTLTVTIPAAALNARDPQVTNCWIYLFGGFLTTYYRFAITGVAPTNYMGLDEFDPADADRVTDTPDLNIDVDDRTRLNAVEFSAPLTAGTGNVTVSLDQNEDDARFTNETLEPGCVLPPDNIIAIAGPWNNRMFCLTSEGWLYPSSRTSPSNFNVYHALDLRRYGTPKWMVMSNGGVHCGFTKDIIRIAGTGAETSDKLSIDLYPDPLNVGNPPVGSAVYTDGTSIIYRSADGLLALTGTSIVPIPQGDTSMLWRGSTRHGISPLNIATGRFRVVMDNGILYMLACEGSATSAAAVWTYNTTKQVWSRLVYPYSFRSIHREPGGTLLAGTTTGRIVTLETGSQDDGADIPVSILTPVMDGGLPLQRKDPVDLQFHVNTGGNTATVTVYHDAQGSSVASYSVATTSADVYRINATAIDHFLKTQLRISGSFFSFILHSFNLTYRERPQMTMAVDPGYIIPANPGDFAWLEEVEIDCISPSDLSLLVYKDDVLYTTLSVTVTPDVRTVYRVPVPRETKARRLRLLLETTASDGEADVGFECYGIRTRLRSSGNQIPAEFQSYYPVGQAP